MLRKIYFIIAVLASVFLIVAGLANENIPVAASGVTYLVLMAGLYFIISKRLLFRFNAPLALGFVLIGWFFAMVEEIIFFPYNPLYEGVSLFGDLILTTPVYVLVTIGWYFVNRKYNFTWFQSMVTGGIALLFIELKWGLVFLAEPVITIIALPALIIMHGFHMVMPVFLLRDRLSKIKRINSKIKYLWGIIIIFVSTLIGAFFINMLKALGVG